MIVTCPACQIRYLAPDTAPGAEAECSVRCPSCLHLWQYSPEGAAIQATLAEVATAAKEDGAASVGRPMPRTGASRAGAGPGTRVPGLPAERTNEENAALVAELPAAGRQRRTKLAALGAVMLGAALVIVVIIAGDRIITMWPSGGAALERLHLAESPGHGLQISSVMTRTADSLVITGDIVNKTLMPRPVPRLRLTLRDGSQSDVGSEVIDPPVEQLMPGETAQFRWAFEHPSIAATGIAVQFIGD